MEYGQQQSQPTSPQSEEKDKIPTRKEIRDFAKTFNAKSNSDVMHLQKLLDKKMGPSGWNMYSQNDSLKIDGLLGPKTMFRLEKFRQKDDDINNQEIFDKHIQDRTNFYRQRQWTKPSDTTGVK